MPTKHVDGSPIYRLKVVLKESSPPIWRRIEVRGSTTLAHLHAILQIAMGWTDSHLHEFVVGDARYGMIDLEWDPLDRPKDERRARLGAIVTDAKDRFRYEYDLGDGWMHEVVVEQISPAETGVRYPRCIGGKRACPPEDVGGIWGYGDFLEALRDPAHEEHETMVEWSGGSFDPEVFDIEAINRELTPR